MQVKILKRCLASLLLLGGIESAFAAQTIEVPMYLTAATGQGEAIGTVKIESSKCGVLLTPNLHGLPSGVHGFHIHEKPDCSDNGMAAGGHFDPGHSGVHEGPYAKGHLGDLPVLVVNSDGSATTPTLAPRFSLKELKGHALMIHAGGDNYSDKPEKLGGGGARIACGIIASNTK